MNRHFSALTAVAIIAPLVTGIAMYSTSQASFADDSMPKMEGHRGRWNQLTPEQQEAKRAEKAARMKEYLNLSDAQAQQIEAIRSQYQPQRQALKEEGKNLKESGDREGMKALREKMMTLREQVHAEIKTVLTSEQSEKLEALKSRRHGRKRNGGADHSSTAG